jgi:hypothetical protein
MLSPIIARPRIWICLAVTIFAACGSNAAQAQDRKSDEPEFGPELARLSQDAIGFVHVRPAELWQSEIGTQLRLDYAKKAVDIRFNMGKVLFEDLAKVESVSIFFATLPSADEWGLAIVTLHQPSDRAKVAKAVLGESTEQVHNGKRFLVSNRNSPPTVLHFVNDRTYLVTNSAAGMTRALDQLAQAPRAGPLDAAFELTRKKHHVVVGVNLADAKLQDMKKELAGQLNRPDQADPAWTMAPLLEAQSAALTIDAGKEIRAQTLLSFADAKQATVATAAAKDAVDYLRLFGVAKVRQQLRSMAGNVDDPQEALFWSLVLNQVEWALRGATVQRSGTNVQVRAQERVDIAALRVQAQAEVKIAMAKRPEVKSPEVKPPEVKPPEVKPPEVKPPETKPPEVKPPEVKPPETKPPEVKPPDVKPPEVKPPETKPPEVKPPEVKPPEVKPPEVKPPEVKPPEVKPPDVKNISIPYGPAAATLGPMSYAGAAATNVNSPKGGWVNHTQDWYAVNMTAATPYVITLTLAARGETAVLSVQDSNGVQLAYVSSMMVAQLTFSPPMTGTYTIICSQDSTTNASTAYALAIPAPVIPVMTALTINAPPVAAPNDAKVTIIVKGPDSIKETPTGSVTLIVDAKPPMMQPLSGGSATFTIASPGVGNHSLSATYSGEPRFLPGNGQGLLSVDMLKPPEVKPPDLRPPETKVPETKPPEIKPPETKPPEMKLPDTKPFVLDDDGKLEVKLEANAMKDTEVWVAARTGVIHAISYPPEKSRVTWKYAPQKMAICITVARDATAADSKEYIIQVRGVDTAGKPAKVELKFRVTVAIEPPKVNPPEMKLPETKPPETKPEVKPADGSTAQLRAQSADNLKQIMLALHSYHDTNRVFPPAVGLAKDVPALSWRVHILPYVGEGELYNEFDLTEPWNGPTNVKLLARMPKVFAPVGVKTKDPFTTFYQAIVGAGAAFEPAPSIGLRLTEFTDGLSNTIGVVEAGEAVPWTKPDDVVYDTQRPMPKLGGVLFPDGFHAGFMDGSVRFFPSNFDEAVLRALITRAGGEAIDPGKLPNR